MPDYCVMVKGPCRGRKCDYWARIRIDKQSVKELIRDARRSIKECKESEYASKREAMKEFWFKLGVKDMSRLCEEAPDLCEKIQCVEDAVFLQ